MKPSALEGRQFILQFVESPHKNTETVVEFSRGATVGDQSFHVFLETGTRRQLWIRPRYLGGSIEETISGAQIVVGVSAPRSDTPNLEEISSAYLGIALLRIAVD